MARTRSSVWVVQARTGSIPWTAMPNFGVSDSRGGAKLNMENPKYRAEGVEYRVWRYEAVPDRRPERKGA